MAGRLLGLDFFCSFLSIFIDSILFHAFKMKSCATTPGVHLPAKHDRFAPK
jgi:hypothetical protein